MLRWLVGGALFWALTVSWAQQSCGPPDGGPPSCAAEGPAGQSDPNANSGAGNPINLITGNKYQREVDLPALPGVLGLEIVRHYNSRLATENAPNGLIGKGWRLSYETELSTVGSTVQILQADGRLLIFSKDPTDPSLCAGNDPAQGFINISGSADRTAYTWVWTSGRKLIFDNEGRLQRIVAPTGEALVLMRSPDGKLLRITDPQGRQLRLTHLDRASTEKNDRFRGIQSIDSPVGRFSYGYQQGAERNRLANLNDVTYPAGTAGAGRQYHYEDTRYPALLTGISTLTADGSNQRIARYAYNDQGLAIRSQWMTPSGEESVELTRLDPPVNSRPGSTVLKTHDGRINTYITGIRGNQYRVLKAIGPGCARCPAPNRQYTYDKLGRLQDATRLDSQGHSLETIRTERDAEGRILRVERIASRDQKKPTPHFLLGYRYEGNPLKQLEITRPSVVPDHESTAIFTYNTAGQITQVKEFGWAPVVQGEPQRIERATTYSYAAVFGHNRLIQIDGPLPNGSKQTSEDSDITQYRYDTQGRVEEVMLPMNRRLQLEYDVAGRMIRTPRREQQLSALDSAASDAPTFSSLGMNDETSHLMPHPIAAPDNGKQVAWQDDAGAVWMKAAFGRNGTAAVNQMLAIQSVRGTAYRLFDDFGRVVAIQNPQQGWQQARYDAANRLIETVDPRGARQVIERDAAGRLTKLKRYAPGARQPESVITQRHDGELLAYEEIRDADGERSSTYAYDSFGRLETETIRIIPQGEAAKALKSTIELRRMYRYDDQGRRIGTELTDKAGRVTRLGQAYNNQGRVSALTSHGRLPRWLASESFIVRDIDWQAVRAPQGTIDYAAGLMHGNGVQEQWPLSQPAKPVTRVKQNLAYSPVPKDDTPRDAAGLPRSLKTDIGNLKLSWNAAGELQASANTRSGHRSQYLYDARGRRVLKIVDAQSVVAYLYEGTKLIAEANADGRFVTAYAYLGYRPVAQLDLRERGFIKTLRVRFLGPAINSIETRRAGQVTAMRDDKGEVLWPTTETSTGIHQPLRYVGQYHDDETGLDYHGARYFDARSGRFISPDPTGISDALQTVAVGKLLDLYDYAGGSPDNYFDPDGAARIRYYAITTGADGKTMGTSRGFTNARWAFVIDDITANPSDTSDLGKLQNEYAATGKTLLVDIGGNYQGSTDIFIDTAATAQTNDFKSHYGASLIEIPSFTTIIDDDKASYLIAYYANDPAAQNSCPVFNLILPEIKFADEEAPINVTVAGSGDAKEQRIVSCGKDYENDIVQRRIQKYSYAAMLLESFPSQINKNCSEDGCPGKSLQGTSLDAYYASYGKTQIIGTTFYKYLLQMRDDLTIDAKTRTALKLDDAALWTDTTGAMAIAFDRTFYIRENFKNEHTATTPEWDKLDAKTQNEFMAGSGLDKTKAEKYWNDMNAWRKNPGSNLEGEASAALATQVMMEDAAVKKYMMGIYKDSAPNGKFDLVSLYLMRGSYDWILSAVNTTNSYQMMDTSGQMNPDWILRQREIEIELATRTARVHNGASRAVATGSLADLMKWDKTAKGRLYAHRFLNIQDWPFSDPKGQPTADYFDLRCTSELPATIKGQGLKLTPLSLPLT